MKALRRFWQAAPVATVVLVIALAAAVVFGARTVAFTIYWHDPAHRQQQIAGWMPPGYVARSWQVPTEVVLDAIGEPNLTGRTSLAEIARRRGVPLDTMVSEIETAVARYHATGEPQDGAPQ